MKKITLLLLAIFMTFAGQVFAQTEDVSVAYVIAKGKKNKIAKYLFGDIKRGMKKYDKTVAITFFDIKNTEDLAFSDFDAVVVVNQKSSKSLNKNIKEFATKNEDQDNLLVVAFLPKKKSKLKDTEGIDVYSSASAESPAARFVKKELSPKILELIESKDNSKKSNSDEN